MTRHFCENVKAGFAPADEFAAFLAHVSDCKDCQRRIYSRFLVEFNQRQTEKI
jgi:hypothetical protein